MPIRRSTCKTCGEDFSYYQKAAAGRTRIYCDRHVSSSNWNQRVNRNKRSKTPAKSRTIVHMIPEGMVCRCGRDYLSLPLEGDACPCLVKPS